MTQKQTVLPDYDEMVALIEALSLKIHVSEVHGAISGFLCVGSNDEAASYIQELIEDKDVTCFEFEIRTLVNLLTVVHKQLSTLTFDFELLVPNDEALLSERAKAVSLWCHGFSDSFLESGMDVSQFKTEEARDALYHITEVSQLDYEELNIAEEDEKAFMELYEYIRMAVLMMHTELQSESAGEVGKDHTMH
mgnify:CR=1 FL=1|tara:strand:+ start:1488 stop:2066 length:579 start_codon:yes stop_codon:yes gene_type:complete